MNRVTARLDVVWGRVVAVIVAGEMQGCWVPTAVTAGFVVVWEKHARVTTMLRSRRYYFRGSARPPKT